MSRVDSSKPGQHDLQFSNVSTFLSPYVHQLITQHTHSAHRDDLALDCNNLIDFNYICEKIPANTDSDDMGSYFTNSVKVLAPMLHAIEDRLSAWGEDTYMDKYGQFLQWTGTDEKILRDVWKTMYATQAPDPVDQLSVMLVTTAVLERSLGDVYLLRGPAPCPSMLKDLLLTKQLQDVLGENVIKVLRLVIGPPTSLNLRNATWHGFPFPGEIPTRCLWFVMLLVPSIGSILHRQNITHIQHRPPVTFPHTNAISEESVLTRNDWVAAINDTEFVPWKTCKFWKKIKQLYTDHRYSVCCALLLYYIEQGLRRVFATVNQCEHRILTAEATVLYTTLDEMLDPNLPDGTENKLRTVIGDDLLEILLDQLSYQNGPRVRDRLSHGEACWQTFPQQLMDNMAVIAVSLSCMFVPDKSSIAGNTLTSLKKETESYHVQFHRISLVKNRILEFFMTTSQVDDSVNILPDMSPRAKDAVFPVSADAAILSDIQSLAVTVIQNWPDAHFSDELPTFFSYARLNELCRHIEDALSKRIHTLYRPQVVNASGSDSEGEILSFLQHIVDECHTTVSNIQQFLSLRQQQLADKQLRSRQRDNFSKFLSSFPELLMVASLCCFTCFWQLYHLEVLKNMSNSQCKFTLKFWKSMLQFCENLRTYSHCDKNKWTEARDLSSQCVKHLQSNLHQLTSAKL